jgi:outer membrane biosynthesis protein TonB
MHPADAANAEVIARATSFRIHLFLGAGRGYATAAADTIADAKAKAAELLAAHGGYREPLIYGIDPEGRAGIVPKEKQAMATVTTNEGIPEFLQRKPGEAKPAAKPAPKKAAPPAPKADPKQAIVVDLRGVTPPKPAPKAEVTKPAARPAAKKAKAEPAPKKAAPKKAPAPKARAAKGEPAATRTGSKTEIVLKMLKKGATRAAIVEATDGWQVDLKQLATRKGLKLHKDADGVITAK